MTLTTKRRGELRCTADTDANVIVKSRSIIESLQLSRIHWHLKPRITDKNGTEESKIIRETKEPSAQMVSLSLVMAVLIRPAMLRSQHRDLPILEVTGNHKKVSQEIAVISASLQPTLEL